MKVNVKYFGMIAEKMGCSNEDIDIELNAKLDLRDYFQDKYPELKSLDYKIAVNQVLSNFIEPSEGVSEIALLPPFAGG